MCPLWPRKKWWKWLVVELFVSKPVIRTKFQSNVKWSMESHSSKGFKYSFTCMHIMDDYSPKITYIFPLVFLILQIGSHFSKVGGSSLVNLPAVLVCSAVHLPELLPWAAGGMSFLGSCFYKLPVLSKTNLSLIAFYFVYLQYLLLVCILV